MSVVMPLLAYSLARLSNYKKWGFRWKAENEILTLGLEGCVLLCKISVKGSKKLMYLSKIGIKLI